MLVCSWWPLALAVKLLLDQPNIDDTLLDASSRSVLSAASSDEVQATILASRQALQTHFLELLAKYIDAPAGTSKATDGGREGEANQLLQLLKSPRAGALDLNALDANKGVSALHEAVRCVPSGLSFGSLAGVSDLQPLSRRKDLVLIKYLVLERNADVFVRDRRGSRVLDNLPAGDHVSNLLKQASNNQKALAQRKEDGSPVTQRCVPGGIRCFALWARPLTSLCLPGGRDAVATCSSTRTSPMATNRGGL